MVPPSFHDFFMAMSGAGGALIGLLFVAVSMNSERIVGPQADPEREGVAASKNVIIMISDVTGYNTWMAGDYWERGVFGKQPFEKFPAQLGVSTFPLNGSYDPLKAWATFSGLTGADGVLGDSGNKGVTESDMAATAMATGFKTAGRVGWAPSAAFLKGLGRCPNGAVRG